jgi:hypothetical protein
MNEGWLRHIYGKERVTLYELFGFRLLLLIDNVHPNTNETQPM